MSGTPSAPHRATPFGGATPILRVRNLAASLDYYVRVLGFTIDWQSDGPLASVSRGACVIFLCEGDQGHPGTWVWIGVNDADAVFEELRRSGARVRLPPTNYPWGYELHVKDVDGHVLRLGSDSRQNQPFGDWRDAQGVRWGKTTDGGWVRSDAVTPSDLMPPGPMRHRVAGTDSLEWFHASGRMTCDVYEAALTSAGRSLQEFASVLDFGCGVGRVLRWLKALIPEARFAGAEIDEDAIAWIRDHYPDVDVSAITNNGLPPLEFEDGRFDLVLAYSVFTHLDATYQDAWLIELRRLVRPGGILLLSISGPRMLDHTLTKSDHANLGDLRRQLDVFES
ncbi:MAG: methyltransferase domain-containing protein, partial [Acidobacteriota bacterium]